LGRTNTALRLGCILRSFRETSAGPPISPERQISRADYWTVPRSPAGADEHRQVMAVKSPSATPTAVEGRPAARHQ
jgi:hypothetical protein